MSSILQGWGTLDSANADQNQATTTSTPPAQVTKETSEQRELRLREHYEQALKAHQNNDTHSAKRQFEKIAADINEHRMSRLVTLESPSKRPRTDSAPLWERRLRYAVHRNLAEVHFTLEEYRSAAQAYAVALDDDRSDFLIWVRAARAAARCGRLHVARRAYETALQMRPRHWLCRDSYRAVLQALGDADEDCAPDHNSLEDTLEMEQSVVDIVRDRAKYEEIEAAEAKEKAPSGPQVVYLKELTWDHLVDSLRKCLEDRISGKQPHDLYPVAHPVKFDYSSSTALTKKTVRDRSDQESDDVQVVDDSSPSSSKSSEGSNDLDVVIVQMESSKDPESIEQDDKEQSVAPQNESAAANQGVTNMKDVIEVSPDKSHIGAESSDQPAEPPVVATDRAQSPHKTNQFENAEGEKDRDATSKREPLLATYATTPVKEPIESASKQPEVRRSSRQRAQNETSPTDGARRQTRTVSEAEDSTQEDRELIDGMLQICLNEKNEVQTGSLDEPISSTETPKGNRALGFTEEKEDLPKEKDSSWVKFVDEHEENKAVEEFVQSFGCSNSGPPDLMLRVLERLAKLKVSQYASTLALLWSLLREKLQLYMPGTPAMTVLIAEAMLESGKKAGKAKIRRFQEAHRLLSQVHSTSSSKQDDQALRIRITWLWSLLYESRGEMQLSFSSAEQGLSFLESMAEFTPADFPDTLGPSLSRYSFPELRLLFKRRISNLKMARDLERARELKNGKDEEAAKRTISILSSSVHASVRSLELDKWRGDDLKIEFEDANELQEWEERLDVETKLEQQLDLFGDACADASDSIGELTCFSIRLRMAVHYYAVQLRTEMQSDDSPEQKGPESCAGRLTDLLVHIRKYVAIIKKISVPASSHLWNCEVGISGWSMKQAAQIAAITLVSLTRLIITKIPLVRFASFNTELGASQKNRRLGFTRCMLAFARCVLLMTRCGKSTKTGENHAPKQRVEDEALTTKMLHVVSFCLRALVARGCCREEGTSGALIKLYMKYLLKRLQGVACQEQEGRIAGDDKDASTIQNAPERPEVVGSPEGSSENMPTSSAATKKSPEGSDDRSEASIRDVAYNWNDAAVIRHELSQCFQCLYQIQELESAAGAFDGLEDNRWLEEGCRVSKHIGLSFATGEPTGSMATMDVDVCKNVWFFYRQRIFEGICLRRRDGGRTKRLRDVLSRLAEALPEDPPNGVTMLPFSALDNIVSDVVETRDNISREAAESVSKLEEEWRRCTEGGKEGNMTTEEHMKSVQLSTLFFEVFALHAMVILSVHDSEYKKQKNAERRKGPKEAADRLLTASSECLIALRSRPWSVGAWILLGRIYVEIADLALDERELSFSSFGLYRAEDLSTLAEGEAVGTVFGRAEACFGFAASLLKHPWAKKASHERLLLSSGQVLGYAYDGTGSNLWCGFGDDGDLFSSFGLTNATTSRPLLRLEDHPGYDDDASDTRRMAAIRLGEAAISLLRLRELRYFHWHWIQNSLETVLPTHPTNRFPDNFLDLGDRALLQLREGQSLLGSCKMAVDDSETTQEPEVKGAQSNIAAVKRGAHWRTGFSGLERMKWYYTLTEAKLVRKAGRSPDEYLPLFHQALEENKELRKGSKQPVDIEPLYKLHSSRMKVLRTIDHNSSAAGLLTLLEKYSYRKDPIVVDVVRDVEKEAEDWIMERKIAIAEDIMVAMQVCCDPKSDVAYTEYYFKPTYCRALILSEVLRDTKGALLELNKLFGAEAAAKVLDQGPDGIYRGYFYKMWNYRITDTGIEPALESERRFVRWRGRVLGLYGQLLKQTGEWRLLAAIIYRLRKRTLEDLPVDGSILDDLVEAYAITSRSALLTSLERGILSNAAVFESSYRRTWDIYIETLRLAQGVKRVRVGMGRGEKSETGAQQLLASGRPRCLVAIHTALRLEHLRWKSAVMNTSVDLEAMKALPMKGSMKKIAESVRLSYVESIQVSASKWPLAEKLMKLLMRRISEYAVSDGE